MTNAVGGENAAAPSEVTSVVKHTPYIDSPLPWRQLDGNAYVIIDAAHRLVSDEEVGAQQDAAYIVHAGNAYPKLVAALARISEMDAEKDSDQGWNEWGEADCFHQCRDLASALLRELGEL